MVGIATQFPADARFMPFVVGIPGIALCLLQLALDAVARTWRPASAIASRRHRRPASRLSPSPEEEPEFGPHTVRGELHDVGYFVAFIAAVLAFGFYVSVPVMLVSFLRMRGGSELAIRTVASRLAATAASVLRCSASLLHIRSVSRLPDADDHAALGFSAFEAELTD